LARLPDAPQPRWRNNMPEDAAEVRPHRAVTDNERPTVPSLHPASATSPRLGELR
jgi:hypothetical protein